MNNVRHTGWACPICGLVLDLVEGSLRCGAGHSFDVSKDSYVNFMSGKARPGIKGDAPAMFTARRRFLGAGHYDALMDRLVKLVRASEARTVYDAGCGEGSYLRMIAAAVPGARVFGTDIARDGIRAAAKADPAGSYAVADTMARLPLADQSVDVVLDVFAPRNPQEFARILSSSGELMIVIPGPDHLSELRNRYRMISMQPDKLEAVRAQFSGWRERDVDEVHTSLNLDAAAVTDVLAMTPNAWFRDGEAAPDFTGTLPVTVRFHIIRFAPPAI